jgi:hypothetical protein
LLVNTHVNETVVSEYCRREPLVGASLVACSSSTGEPGKPIIVPAGGGAGGAEGEPQVAVSGDVALYCAAQAFNVEADPIAPGEGHLKLGASQGWLIFGHRRIQADAMYVYWAVNGVDRDDTAPTRPPTNAKS